MTLEISSHPYFRSLLAEGQAERFSDLSHHNKTQIVVKNEIARLIRDWAADGTRLLDIGASGGHPTVIYRDQMKNPDRAVIYDWTDFRYPEVRSEVEFSRVDLEVDRFPDADESFDVVVCNQVLEHLKNIFTPLSEIVRVLKPNGRFIVSVPNLAALHNRVLLTVGKQPTCVDIGGSHVRGYALASMTRWFQLNGHLRVLRLVPVGLAPLTSAVLPRPLRDFCHTPIWLLEKQQSDLPSWDALRRTGFTSTNFFRDEPDPAP